MSRSVKVNFILQASYRVALIIIPIITVPYLSRVLGADIVGTYSYTRAIADYFVMFAMLGMSTYGVREVASASDNRDLRTRRFWGAYGSQLIMGLISCAAYVFYLLACNPAGGFVVALVWGMYVLSALLDVSWLLFGVEEFKVTAIRAIATRLASMLIIFAFVHDPDDLWIYCASIAGSFLADQLLIWPFVGRYVDFKRPRWRDIEPHFRPSLMLFVPVIAISLYNSLDKILLGHLAGMQQAGFFEYSEKLSRMPMAIITAMGTVMLPRMTAELALGRRGMALELLEQSVWAMQAMAFALAFGIAAIAPEFAVVFLGEGFAECDSIMCILAVIIPVVSATNVIGKQYLVPIGRYSRYTLSVCVGAAVNVSINLALIPLLGAMGAAIATVAAELAVLFVQAWFVRGELPLLRYALNALPFLLVGLAMFAVVRRSAGWLVDTWGLSALSLAFEIAIGVVSFVLISIVWCVAVRDKHFANLFLRVG